MVTVTTIPAASASATRNLLLVQLREALCQAMSLNSMIKPQVNVTFTAGTATTRTVPGTSASTYDAIVPIIVSGSIVYQPKGSCRAVTKLFNEIFSVAFVGLSTAPTTFTIETGLQEMYPSNVKGCNRAYEYDINTAISITAA